jgi:hypothetical protein
MDEITKQREAFEKLRREGIAADDWLRREPPLSSRISVDWQQLFADLEELEKNGLSGDRAFESLPVGKYLKLAAADASGNVEVSAARAQGRG